MVADMSTPHKRSIFFLIGFMTLLICISPPKLRAWQFGNESLYTVTLDKPLSPIPALTYADFNRDGQDEWITLSAQQVNIHTQSNSTSILWNSPDGWQVRQAVIADLDHDGFPELALLVWRPFQPWPVDTFLPHGGRIEAHQNRAGLSCHLILIGWRGGQFTELWAGSALARPLRSLSTVDMDGDGKEELVVLESRYNDPLFLPARSMAIWRWNGFGFDLLARSEGSFHSIAAFTSTQGAVVLLTQ